MEWYNLTDEICTERFSVAFNGVVRTMHVYHIVLSGLAMWAILHFFVNFRQNFVFHPNIKMLFACQFSTCFVHSLCLAAFQTHHLIVSFTSSAPCDVVLLPGVYAGFQIPFALSLFCIETTQVVMIIERTIASVFFVCYERSDTRLGQILLFLAVFFPILFAFLVYGKERFDVPQVSALATPPGAAFQVNFLFVILIFLNVCGLFVSFSLVKYNQKRQNEASFVLSSRYQSRENVRSSHLLTMLTTMQLVIFLVYGVCQFSFRIFWSAAFRASATSKALIELAYTPPLYCLALPLISIIVIRHSQRERNSSINSLVMVKATGREGWRNYSDMLAQQWA